MDGSMFISLGFIVIYVFPRYAAVGFVVFVSLFADNFETSS